jgi:hypothetical protein
MKLLRVVRLMKFFRELRLVVDSLLGSCRTLVWSCLLILILSFVVGLVLVQGCTNYRYSSESPDNVDKILQYWSSLPLAMITLYKATTGGDDWSGPADSLSEVGTLYTGFFYMYIAFWNLVMVNALNALFVDSIMNYSAKDQSAIIQDKLNRKEEYMNACAALYKHMDQDASGEVTLDEFRQHLCDPRLLMFAESIDIEADDLEQFFSVLSCNGTKSVDLEAFVVGCIRLSGRATAMDMMDTLIRTRKLCDDLEAFDASTTKNFQTSHAMNHRTHGIVSQSHGVLREVHTHSHSAKQATHALKEQTEHVLRTMISDGVSLPSKAAMFSDQVACFPPKDSGPEDVTSELSEDMLELKVTL